MKEETMDAMNRMKKEGKVLYVDMQLLDEAVEELL